MDRDQAVRVSEGERTEEQVIHDAEDGGVRADANRQRGECDCRKAWALPQHAERVPHVLDDSLEPHPAPHLAHLLFQERDVAQLLVRRVLRVNR